MLVACVIGLGIVAVVAIAMLPSPDPVPVSTPKRPPPVRPAQPAPALSPELQAAATPAPKLAPATTPEPARPAAPVTEARMGADGVFAVKLVVPMHSSTIPAVRIPAGTRGVRLLLDVPVPANLDGLSVSVRGPEGRAAARLTRTSEGGLAVELGAALQDGVHEVLVTNDDETTLAHHRFHAVPAGGGP